LWPKDSPGQALAPFLAVIFFVPQALLFSELGTAFPQEGGPYYWTRLAFGHLAGAVNNFQYWITNPVWIGGTLAITCIGAVEVFFNNGNTVPTTVFYAIALAFVWLSIVAAITSFSVGKWLPTAGAFARFLLLGLFMLTVIIFVPSTASTGWARRAIRRRPAASPICGPSSSRCCASFSSACLSGGWAAGSGRRPPGPRRRPPSGRHPRTEPGGIPAFLAYQEPGRRALDQQGAGASTPPA